MAKNQSSSLSLFAALIFIVLLIGFGIYTGSKKSNNSNNNGKVTFTEYFDFECPACEMFAKNVLPQLEKKYAGKIDFVYKQFPLPQHSHARAAAAASICAGKQGKFFEYRDLLVTNYEKWTADTKLLDDYGKSLNLDEAKFNACRVDKATSNEIDKSFQEGINRGVEATPTVFINDQKIEGVGQISEYESKIDALLKK